MTKKKPTVLIVAGYFSLESFHKKIREVGSDPVYNATRGVYTTGSAKYIPTGFIPDTAALRGMELHVYYEPGYYENQDAVLRKNVEALAHSSGGSVIAMSSWQLPLEQEPPVTPPSSSISLTNVGAPHTPPSPGYTSIWSQSGRIMTSDSHGNVTQCTNQSDVFRKTIPVESIGFCNHEPHDISIGYRRWIICKKCNIDL